MADVGIREVAFALPLSGGTFPQAINVDITSSPPGKTPKAAVYLVTSAVSNNLASTTARVSVGFVDSALAQKSVGVMMEDADVPLTTAAVYRIDNSTVIQLPVANGSSLQAEANVTTFHADGAELSVSGASNGRGHAIYFYGADVQSAVRVFTGSALSNNALSISGLSFAPDVVIVASVNQTVIADGFGNPCMLSLGFAARTSSTQGCFCVCGEQNVTPTSVGSLAKDARVAVRLVGSAGTITEGPSLELTSWNSDGVTFTTRGTSAALEVIVLCLYLPDTSAWAGVPTLATSAIASFSRTDPQFKPQMLMAVGGVTATAGTVVSTRGAFTAGVATGAAEEGSISMFAADNQAVTSDSRSFYTASNFYSGLITDAALDWIGNLASFDVLGYTVSVTDASAADRPTVVLVISQVNTIVDSVTETITDGHVLRTDLVFTSSDTETITDGFVALFTARVFVSADTESITDAAVFVLTTTSGDTETISDSPAFMVGLSTSDAETITDDFVALTVTITAPFTGSDDTETITDGLIYLLTGTLLGNNTETITDGTPIFLGRLIVGGAETETITDEAVLVRRAGFRGISRGTMQSAGGEAGHIYSAGAARGEFDG